MLRCVAGSLLLSIGTLLGGTLQADAKTKQKFVPRPEPELKILDLKVSPVPYAPDRGPLEFTMLVQLPKEADQALMLEVSSLLTSSSMTSLRFLSTRQPLNAHTPHVITGGTDAKGDPQPKHVRIQLSWDGLDHNRQIAPRGSYDYQVRAKLLSNGEKGQKTQMLSWPKRGTFVIK